MECICKFLAFLSKKIMDFFRLNSKSCKNELLNFSERDVAHLKAMTMTLAS